MANADASLIFDAGLDYSVSFDNISKSLKKIVSTLEQQGVTQLKFSVAPNSLANIKEQISAAGINFNSANTKVSSSMDVFVDGIKSKIATYEETIKKFKNLSFSNGGYEDIKSTVSNMNTQVEIFNSNTANIEKQKAAYQELIQLSKEYSVKLQNLNAQVRTMNTSAKDMREMTNLQTQVQSIWSKHGNEIKLNTEALKKFQAVQSKLNKGLGDAEGYQNLNEAKQAVSGLKNSLTEAGIYTDSLSVRLKKMFSLHFNTALTMAGVHLLTQGLQQVIENVKEVEAELTQLEIVTGTSGTALERFADKAFAAAEKVGASATDIMSSTETWARLGYSLDDSLSLAATTAQFSNVGNVSVEDATTSMTSILKAYSLDAGDAEKIADILTNVGAKYAISASELGEALQAGGASLEAANNSLEQSVALMAAGNAAIQDASVVGNAMKTKYYIENCLYVQKCA